MSDKRVGWPKGYSPRGNIKDKRVVIYLDEFEEAKLRKLSRHMDDSGSEVMRQALSEKYKRTRFAKVKK